MLQLYVVLALLVLECALVVVFLLPRRSFTKPLQRLLSSFLGANTTRKVLIAVLIIMAFLVVEAYQEMRYREREERKPSIDKFAEIGQALMVKNAMFRSQRNFYLTFFTLALYVMMFRLRGIHAEFEELERSIVAKKQD